MHMHVVARLSCFETSLESVDDEQVRLFLQTFWFVFLCLSVVTLHRILMRMIGWIFVVKVTNRFTYNELRKRLGINDI